MSGLYCNLVPPELSACGLGLCMKDGSAKSSCHDTTANFLARKRDGNLEYVLYPELVASPLDKCWRNEGHPS